MCFHETQNSKLYKSEGMWMAKEFINCKENAMNCYKMNKKAKI